MALTVRDLLNEFFIETCDLKSNQPDGERIPDDDKDGLIDEYIHIIKERIIG